MKNVRYGLALAALCSSSMLFSQGVVDALKYSQQDIRGTARYMGMAGAFGALGGDITTLSQNPAGIGVYRNSDIAATIDLSNQVSSVNTAGNRMSDSKFNVSCNNFGFVWTVRFNQEALKNLNFGFAYNKQKSFDRSYKAGYSGITGASSLSGYIAHLSEGYSVADLRGSNNYNPYDNLSNPWLNVLGAESYLINPKSTTGNTWNSIVGNGTNTTGDLYVREKGSIDEYNFNVGGNIYNVFYWGLGIAVTDFSYDIQSGYGENFTGGYISSGDPNVDGWYLMRNALHTNGSGIKVNLGVIMRATDNFRLGFAFHTPNYYKMTDSYVASVKYDFNESGTPHEGLKETPSGSYDYEFQSPWRMIASAAYVFGQSGILSFDYEYTSSNNMSFDDPYSVDAFYKTNQEITEMVSPMHTFKIGGEFRITPQISARLGYAYQTSPVKSEYRSGREIPTAGTLTMFTLDRETNYFTVGLGYRFSNFYFFSARVFREMSLVPIELQKVYRQQDERFVEVLDKIRNNTATREELDLLNSRYLPQYEPEKDNFSITLATRRDQVDYINENRLSGLPGKEYTFIGTIKGDFPEGSLPTSLELVVKTGAQVIFIKNDPERRWVNGTIGMISDITPDEKIEVVLESGEMYELERCVWENIKYTYNEKEKTIEESVLGTFLQFPIRLAWAITVHKSQGLTFNRVIVDFTGGAFAGGQTYVALSRCRSLEGIVLKRQITHRDIFVNPDIVRFSKGFNDSVLIEQSLKLAQADRLYVEAVNAFDEGDFDKMLQSFFKAIHTRYDIEKPVIQRYIRKKLNVINQLRVKNRELQQALSDRNTVLRKYAHEYYLLGNECITKAKDVRAALANFDKALSLDPTLIDAWVRKGITLEDQGDEHGAMACYNEAVRLSPLSFKALYNRGKLRYKQGDYETALSDFAKAVKQKPLHATAHDRLGDTFIKLEMPDMAARHWAIAEELREKKQQNNK